MTRCSDGDLAALSIGGRDRAFAELMARHRDPIYRLVRGYVGDADEALDIVQESFVSAHGALHRYNRDQPMRNWLARIAINKCRDWGRRRAVRRLFVFAVPLSDPVAVAVADPAVAIDDALVDRLRLAAVSAAIADLPATLKEPLILHTIDGLSQAETAAILGISEKAVETRIARARAKLSDKLQ